MLIVIVVILKPVYPRWRGELSAIVKQISLLGGLSPLARGTPLFPLRESGEVRFIPAGAGNSQTFSDIAFGKVLSQRSVAAQNLLRHDLGYDRESSDFLWDKDREFSTRLGEESVDVYLARKGIDGQLRPLVDEIDFCWEKSRLSVRKSWWQKNSGTFQCPDEETLTCFRKRHHRPSGHIVLVSEMGEASYYSKRFGLV